MMIVMTKMRARDRFSQIYNAIVTERECNANDEQLHGYRYQNDSDSNGVSLVISYTRGCNSRLQITRIFNV